MRLTRMSVLVTLLGAVAVTGVSVSSGVAQDVGNNAVRPLKVNQTEGYFDGQNQVFTYGQNFHCTIEPFDDLDGLGRQGDGAEAAADPDEMLLPECISGETRGGSEPTIDPAGTGVDEARKLFAILPVFDANGNGIPETIDPVPGVDLQCPEPGPPSTEEDQPVGSCTMHPGTVFVDPILDEIAGSLTGLDLPNPLEALPTLPSGPPVDLPVALPTVSPGVVIPLPGHSHIVETGNDEQAWWQVLVILVEDRSVWPDVDGDCPAGRDRCLTSLEALRAAQADGGAGRDIPTNIWLFFANEPLDHSAHGG